MINSYSESYKAAGVDITAGYEAVNLIKKHVIRTKIPGVIEGIGGFGGLFSLTQGTSGYTDPVLVSGTDGVGTKLKIAFYMDKHDTIGIDCVAMCVNDIICSGAKPLFFLDYLACGKIYPKKIEKILSGIADGCVQAGCALIGGETAEHPGMMPDEEYDLAGFAVGLTDRAKIPDKNSVKKGDVIISLASSGVHSNGFSLTRKIFQLTKNSSRLKDRYADLGKTLGEELLTPTKIYVNGVLKLFAKGLVVSACHITGGGFYENIPRMFDEKANIGAIIHKSKLKIQPVFNIIAKEGNIPQRDMFNTYNMGTGFCIITGQKDADEAVNILKESGEDARIIGEVKTEIQGVTIE